MVDSEILLPNLLCHENESCLTEEFHKKDENFQFNSVPDSDFEYVEMLIQKETNSGNDYSPRSEKSWLKGARLDAVKWILDTRALFGFHFRTAYLSLVYFDQFFSRRSLDDGKIWAIRLLSVACLSVAAKMEECDVPALSEYHINEYNFEGNLIQRMELLVLSTLEWKMNVVTPFEYLHYFATKFYGEFGCNELVKLAIKLILAVMEEINLVELRPSIIAAAAILAAYDQQLTKNLLEIKINLVPSWGNIEKDRAFSCYNLLQKIAMLKFKSPKSVISPHSLSTHPSSVDVLDDSAIGTKRSLTYSDGDQYCPLSKTRKP
ncbi:hypothetical protein ACJIZ3_014953 [Penstemon smallii]|uniref:Uncharacterized protein n=1 Tax=Penstemon smallii TaxID=265156 RepID=A0ABD3RLA9_9LAMI